MKNLTKWCIMCLPVAIAIVGSLQLIQPARSAPAVRHPILAPIPGVTRLLVGSWNTNAVLRYDGVTGAFIDAFVPPNGGGLNRPHGLRYGWDGNLLVAGAVNNS